MVQTMGDLPKAYGRPELSALFKQNPEDFKVDEDLGIEPTGSGEHLLVQVQKTGMNTLDVVRYLSAALNVRVQDIGYCGQKDKQSVSTQWLSVPGSFAVTDMHNAIARFNDQHFHDTARMGKVPERVVDLRLCQVAQHARKLRRGSHRSNQFTVILRNVRATQLSLNKHASLQRRAGYITQHGVPNYIGPQRFGRDYSNLKRAESWFKQPRRRITRDQRSRYLSTARSELFNAVCAARVQASNWLSPMPGEPLMLSGSRSFFLPNAIDRVHGESNEELEARISSFDVHTSAPWWGQGAPLSQDDCLAFETEALEKYRILKEGLASVRLPQQRRAVRATVRDFIWRWENSDTLRCSFRLEPGVFATAVLAEFCVFSEQREVQVSG